MSTSPFDPVHVGSGTQDNKIRSFLQQCKQMHQRRASRNFGKERLSKLGGGREAREAARITARSYDAIHKKKAEGDSISLRESLPATSPVKKYPDLYVQGASSYTDLSSRRAEHENMIRGNGRTGGMNRHSSTSSESLDENLFTPFGGAGASAGLERVQSMESGISSSQQNTSSWKMGEMDVSGTSTLPRSSSQGTLPPFPKSLPPLRPGMARSTESFHTQTHGLASARRTPSYIQLSSGLSREQDWPDQLAALEERVGVLASRFLYERQDMFKQILRARKLT